MKVRHRGGRRSLGLYTNEQTKSETPFTFFAVTIVGAVFFLGGLSQLHRVLSVRAKELEQLGNAEAHISGFFLAIVMMISGAFIAHPGMIYYARRFRRRSRLILSRKGVHRSSK